MISVYRLVFCRLFTWPILLSCESMLSACICCFCIFSLENNCVMSCVLLAPCSGLVWLGLFLRKQPACVLLFISARRWVYITTTTYTTSQSVAFGYSSEDKKLHLRLALLPSVPLFLLSTYTYIGEKYEEPFLSRFCKGKMQANNRETGPLGIQMNEKWMVETRNSYGDFNSRYVFPFVVSVWCGCPIKDYPIG